MKLSWFKGLSEEEKEEFKKVLLNNSQLRKQVLLYLKDRYDTVERRGLREEDYQSTDWVYLQAFNNGRLSMIREIADLFDFEEK